MIVINVHTRSKTQIILGISCRIHIQCFLLDSSRHLVAIAIIIVLVVVIHNIAKSGAGAGARTANANARS